jgi:hypothetical protein
MQDSKTYRQYAEDCRRIAQTMSAKDKAVMLEMAKVWDERAEESERLAAKDKAGGGN